jgi:RND superfamily putative drug exporter
MLASIGRWCFHHRWATLLLWLGALALVVVSANRIGDGFSTDIDPPDSEATRGFDVLDTWFGGLGAADRGFIVFEAEAGVDDPVVRSAMEQMFVEVDALDGVSVASPYAEGVGGQIAREGPLAGRVAYANLDLDRDLGQTETSELGTEIADLRPDVEGLRVEIGGNSLADFEPPDAELIGLAFAVVILIVAFGSVLAMGLPIAVALGGVGMGVTLITLVSNVITVPSFATTLGAMIGLGVGIDYALFIVTRYRETLRLGLPTHEAAVVAIDTAGRSVIFAGLTVVVSLLGLFLMGLEFIAGLGLSAAVTVAITMAASITLLPALLGFAGERIERTRWRGLVAAGLVAVALLGAGLGLTPFLLGAPLALVVLAVGRFVPALYRPLPPRRYPLMRETAWYRWSRTVQAHPWRAAIAGTLVLGVLALPVLGLRLGFSDEGNFPADTTTRQAYDLLAEGFGPGVNGPLLVTIELDGGDPALLAETADAIATTEGVASVLGPIANDPEAPQAAIVRVIPTTSPQDVETERLVSRLRQEVIPPLVGDGPAEILVSGSVATQIDISDYLGSRMPWFFAGVLGMSFLLLMVVFRSLLVPLKAVLMNLLSIASAYGIVVAVFQWGWFSELFGIGGGAPIEPFVPMMLFAIVFGLSMDYEVFLLSRIREEYLRTGDAQNSVADGLAMTARVITAAAAIMVVVFGSFLLEDDRTIKLFGTGLGLAVLLDATLVRMLLVPATMELLGERNWWLPRWLDRALPRLDVEGSPVSIGGGGDEAAAEPEPDRERHPVGAAG